MDVRQIQNVILCRGKNHQQKGVQSAEAFFLRRAISWPAWMSNAGIVRINTKYRKFYELFEKTLVSVCTMC